MIVTNPYTGRTYEMTDAQVATLTALCKRYGVEFVAEHYSPQFDLPDDYVAGWIGGTDHGLVDGKRTNATTIYVGVSAEGDASS